MLEAPLYGLLTGIIMSLMLGTVFFALIQNSIDNGFKSGIIISIGVIFSDILLILITYFNANLIPSGGLTEQIVRILGFLFLLFYGLSNLLRKKRLAYPETRKGRIWYYLITGFLLNILNPGNFIGWMAINTHLQQVAEYSPSQCFLFFCGALSAIFCMEMIISFAGSSLKKYISDKMLLWIDYVVGVVFIGFAIYLVLPFFGLHV